MFGVNITRENLERKKKNNKKVLNFKSLKKSKNLHNIVDIDNNITLNYKKWVGVCVS